MYGDPNEFRRRQRELVRDHARTSLYGFYRLVFPALAPEASFSSAPHFRVLARALEKVGTGETRRLLIAIPPRHGKSILASVALPAWILGQRPDAEDHLRVLRRPTVQGLFQPFPRPPVVAAVSGDLSWNADRRRRRLAGGSAHERQGLSPGDDGARSGDRQGRAFHHRRRSFQGRGSRLRVRPATPSTTGSRGR